MPPSFGAFSPNSKKALRRIEECTGRAGSHNRKQAHSARNLLPTKVFTNKDTAMTERLSKDGRTRILLISIFSLVALFGHSLPMERRWDAACDLKCSVKCSAGQQAGTFSSFPRYSIRQPSQIYRGGFRTTR